MKRSLFVSRIVFVIILACFSHPALAQVIERSGGGWREDVDGVRVVHLSGTPREIGLQHGTLLKVEINTLLDYFYNERGNFFGAGFDTMERAAPQLEKHIPDDLIEEMKGIAEGAEIDYKKILFANTFLDVVSAGWVGVAPGCSNFAAMPAVSGTGQIIHGRNLDWSANEQLSAANTVFFVNPDKGIPFASLSWPGMAGTLTGLNAQQISMGEMTSVSDKATLDGTPFMIHLRILLQNAGALDEAYRILEELPRTTGYNTVVTDGKTGDGFLTEMNAERIVRKGPENGFLIRTNHYLHPGMQSTQKKLLMMFYGNKKNDSFYRYERFQELLSAASGNVDPAKAMAILSDKRDPFTGGTDPELENTICQKNTLQSVVMLPQSLELYVALKSLPAPDGGYVHLKFDPESQTARAE